MSKQPDLMAALEKSLRLATEPAPLRCIYATHSVPYGRVYRMWTTRGELIAYVNRGYVADMPRVVGGRFNLSGIFGIPVVYE